MGASRCLAGFLATATAPSHGELLPFGRGQQDSHEQSASLGQFIVDGARQVGAPETLLRQSGVALAVELLIAMFG